MRAPFFRALLVAAMMPSTAVAIGQMAQPAGGASPRHQPNYQNMTPEQRAEATRVFLGLGAEPDKAAAARGEPVFQRNCAFCHGRQARGATGPSLITSDQILGDDHGERFVPYAKKGRPDKGMPSFAAMRDDALKDIAEFLHLQVEEVANRGAYRVLNILVGDAKKGQAYVAGHCMACHHASTFAHIAAKFRSPEQLQRGWIWPQHHDDDSLSPSASVTGPGGATFAGRVTQVSDFRITIIDQAGQSHLIERVPGVDIRINDPLAAHQAMIMTLRNDDMHNVTAYLASLK